MKNCLRLCSVLLGCIISVSAFAQEPVIIGRADVINTQHQEYDRIGLKHTVPINYLAPEYTSEHDAMDIERLSRIVLDYVGNYDDLPDDPQFANAQWDEFVTLEKKGLIRDIEDTIIIANHLGFTWFYRTDGTLQYVYSTSQIPFSYKDTIVELQLDQPTTCGSSLEAYCQTELSFHIDDEIFSMLPGQSYAPQSSSIAYINVIRSEVLNPAADLPTSQFEKNRVTYLVAMRSIGLSNAQKIFSDVPSDHPYREAIQYVRDNEIVQGYSDGSYRPDHSINRAELTKMLVGGSIHPSILEACSAFSNQLQLFNDIDHTAWYTPFLCSAKISGWIGGYPDGSFKPANTISFVEAAKIIVSAYELSTQPVPGEWFLPYYNVLEEQGAIPETVRSYDHELTRGELAFILHSLKHVQ